jgi:predicted nucleotidyltransferase
MPRPREAVELPPAVQEIIDRIVEGYDPERIIVFGSYARGDATPESDLDVLVIKDTPESWIDRVVAVSLLSRPRLIPAEERGSIADNNTTGE